VNPKNRAILVATILLCGCGSRAVKSRTPSKPELEATMARRLKLTEVTLTQGEKGRYTGTGKGADGKQYDVKLSIAERTVAWEKLFKKSNGEIETMGGGFDWSEGK